MHTLKTMTVPQLQDLAKSKGVEFKGMSKKQLVRSLGQLIGLHHPTPGLVKRIRGGPRMSHKKRFGSKGRKSTKKSRRSRKSSKKSKRSRRSHKRSHRFASKGRRSSKRSHKKSKRSHKKSKRTRRSRR